MGGILRGRERLRGEAGSWREGGGSLSTINKCLNVERESDGGTEEMMKTDYCSFKYNQTARFNIPCLD